MLKNSLKFVLMLVLAWMLASNGLAAISNQSKEQILPLPDTDLLPEEVVRIVIRALANNDKPYPDAGIETTFKFASPANKVSTGPLDKFTRMVKAYPYDGMVNHVKSDVSEVIFVGEEAYLLVKLLARDGSKVAFAFRLSQQAQGRYQGMWMTDAVWPVNKP